MTPRFVLLLVLVCTLAVPTASAFDLQQVYIEIDHQGDAQITLVYDGSAVEYLGIRTLVASTSTLFLADTTGSSGKKDKPDKDFKILCAEPGVAGLSVSRFATVHGKQYSTPAIDLSSYTIPDELKSAYAGPVDLTTDVTIVFPDGYSEQQKGVTVIRGITHTLEKDKVNPPAPPENSCKKKKDLPLSGVIPDEVAPVAAVGAGAAATAVGLTSFGSALSAWLTKILVFCQNAVTQVLQGTFADRAKERRDVSDKKIQAGGRFGFTRGELAVILIGAVIIGVLFFFAGRTPFDPVTLAVYIIMGGGALAVHETAHWYLNKKYQCQTEVQFWGLGAVIMAVTAWLFGSVFAQPTLTMVRTTTPLTKRSLGMIMLSGPVLSVMIAFVCLLLVPLGGIFRTAGSIGFSINLLTGVFEMLPVTPCEGRWVWFWNKMIWVAVFVPLMLLYFVVNL